ncbi:phage tail sheath family protein [Sphingomonas oligophenolica]|uniref:Phage tail sheath C-terminal domain-containing protein n=1 Tax=Sphingomonas oligophenolica TaxID=301154 RepID=A0ABU9Y8I3_9SPHN
MSANVPTNSGFQNRKTPGVYITELDAFPPSIVGVATAVPIFIGYTETARDPSTGEPVYLQAIPLSSMADYRSYFGAGFDAKGVVAAAAPAAESDFQAFSWDGSANLPSSAGYVVGTSVTPAGTMTYGPQFNLYSALALFFANGGGNCFVISVANYWGTASVTPPADSTPAAVDVNDLLAGLAVSNTVRGGTMLVVPDACLLVGTDAKGALTYPGYQAVVVEMLRQSGTLQDRMAILDLPGALEPANWSADAMQQEADAFYAAIAPAADVFSYGAAYGPALQSSLLAKTDLSCSNLSGSAAGTTLMNNLLTTQAQSLYAAGTPASAGTSFPSAFVDIAAHIAAAFPVAGASPITSDPANIVGVAQGLAVSLPGPIAVPTDGAGIEALDQYLLAALPLLGTIQQILADKLNVVPPSGAMAGIWALNDANHGVWIAPANMALNQVLAPKVLLNDAQQGAYNVPLNGNAIDILRAFVNRGTVVWGARTLDGNSDDYRYIQVRRTLIYIEQSIQQALEPFTFAANDGTTWMTVTSMISNFLTQLWQAGGLMGDKASDAFTVQCGLGSTMTAEDILNGYMIVNVTLQMIHPAEFIELTFKQAMQGA